MYSQNEIKTAWNEMLTARRNQLETTANRLDELVYLYERDRIFKIAARLRTAAATLREALEFCEE